MIPVFRLALAAGLFCLAACGRAPDDTAAAPPPSPSAGTPAPDTGATAASTATPPPASGAVGAAQAAPGREVADGAIADHYACDAGTRLDRQEDGSFRAAVPGNPPVRLARIAGSTPPVFTGASLYLRIEPSGDAILSQGDRTNELRCKPGQASA